MPEEAPRIIGGTLRLRSTLSPAVEGACKSSWRAFRQEKGLIWTVSAGCFFLA